MRPPLVISFHTPDVFFSGCADRLRKSCDRLELDHEIVRRDDLADWHRMDIIRHKPAFIADKLREHDRPLLWTDADSEFVSDPMPLWLKACGKDFGFRPRWHLHRQTRQVFAGTIYASPRSLPFVMAWALNCREVPPQGDDQYYLAGLLKLGCEALRMAEWGRELVSKSDENGPHPVILHHMTKHPVSDPATGGGCG